MLGIYFSGTGNSRYILETFLKEYGDAYETFAIEDPCAVEKIRQSEELLISYPVQYSNLPKMLRDFIDENRTVWQGKKIFVIATMGMFSGDGAGVPARLLRKYGAFITGGLHVRMPDSIADEKVLKRSSEKNKELVESAAKKAQDAAKRMRNGNPPKAGLGFWSRMAGLFGQRLYFYGKTRHYTDKLKIDPKKCIGCSACTKICPMKNLYMEGKTARASGRCTMCYRCINTCPARAVTLLGKQVWEQGTVEKYLS